MQTSWRRVLGSISSRSPVAVVDPPPMELLGGRYQVLNHLGSGGMGAVYRALDRLSGRVVTLKRLRVTAPASSSRGSSSDRRLELAREFSLLASLRHPNIISVLDYGFDTDRMPFFAMDLEENAVTIIDAGRGRPLLMQVDLLVQTLRALAYLHRHGILHRDLKPENVVVVDGQVKVLDFGLSAYLDSIEPAGDWVGTFPYMAPEILRGDPVTARTDIHALGMIAYELLTGDYPFDRHDPAALHADILFTPLPRPGDDLDDRVRPVLAGLLAKRAAERYPSANEVVRAFAAALDQPLAVETVATRESFLQAAPFIGRRGEVARLMAVVDDARQGSGAAWLVGGESGVGKSRLLDEIQTRARVGGVTVLRGQARSRGGAPYHVWRDVVSGAALRTAQSDDDVAVLRAVVPDIGRLLGRDVQDAPTVAPEAAQSRLLLAVEELFRAQPGPVLVILEDLQWAGSESLRLLSWLAQVAPSVRLAVLGSYRNDEAPDVPKAVETASVLRLRRLSADEIEALGVAMIGEDARRPDLVALLVQETEGIPFFLVEVVRTLAESGSGLEGLAHQPLPQRVPSGGVQRVVRRRLSRVPEPAVAPLRTAAVVGRAVDLALLSHVHPEIDASAWAAQCTAAAVLELRDQSWRFAHDKLREQLLADMSPAVLRGLHRRVAEALESSARSRDENVTALAYHWREAGDPDREAEYAFRAGMLALETGACQEAVVHLARTLEVLEQRVPVPSGHRRLQPWWAQLDPNTGVDPDAPSFRLAVVESGLTDAYFGLGDLRRCREHWTRALTLFGHGVPTTPVATVLAVLRQVVLRMAQEAVGVHSADPARAARATAPVARVLMRLIDTYFYSVEAAPLAWAVLRMMTECGPQGPSSELARAYALGALLAGMGSAKRLGETWCARAVQIAEACGSDADRGWVLARVAVFRLSFGEWQAAAAAARACVLAQEVGDLRSYEENKLMSGLLDSACGRYEAALRHIEDAYDASLRSADRQMCWDATVLGANVMVRAGRHDEARAVLRDALDRFATMDQFTMRSEHAIALGAHAVASLRAGDQAAAWESAARAAALLTESRPVAYWLLEAIGRTSEALFGLLEIGAPSPAHHRAVLARAEQVVRAGRQFARMFPIGWPLALLSAGSLAWMQGRRRRGRTQWRRALAVACRLEMPFETARAHAELGRHMPDDTGARREHLARAAAIFEQLGSRWELAMVQAWRDTAEARGAEASGR
jgi:eukaryotic-like serine/threonine-protein kinase